MNIIEQHQEVFKKLMYGYSRGPYSLKDEQLLYNASKLNEEAGEVIKDVLGKIMLKKPITDQKIIEELQDSYGCIVALCNVLGITIAQLAEGHQTKILTRSGKTLEELL